MNCKDKKTNTVITEKEDDYENVCRTCLLESVQPKSIFTMTLTDQRIYFVDFIRSISNVKITRLDSLPQNICTECIIKLENSFKFTEMCKLSDNLLRSQMKRGTENVEFEGKYCNEDEDSINADFNIQSPSESISKANDRVGDNLIVTQNKYQCSVCNESYSNKTKFIAHGKTHNKKNPFHCAYCFQTFSRKVNLSVHLRSHIKNEDRKFSCTDCGQSYMYEYMLKQHQYKHSDNKPFPCSVCMKGCVTAESLKRHMKIHEKNYKKKSHICHLCSKCFDYPSLLAEHIKCHTGYKPYLCSECGKSFRQSGALHYHQRIHTGLKPFSCDICKENFMSQSVLKVHMRKHTNERPYICHECGMTFRQSTDLRGHRRTHSGDKPVLCTICGKRMSTTGQLTIHIRSHTGEKPFKCKSCPKAFSTRTLLVKHDRIHSGERPYTCDTCGRKFNQSSTLKSHLKTHDPNRKRSKGKLLTLASMNGSECEPAGVVINGIVEKSNSNIEKLAKIQPEKVNLDVFGNLVPVIYDIAVVKLHKTI